MLNLDLIQYRTHSVKERGYQFENDMSMLDLLVSFVLVEMVYYQDQIGGVLFAPRFK